MKTITRTTTEWIDLAKQKHGDKYDYANVEYHGTHTRVIIGCPVHGQFSQLAYKHLSGLGCNRCGRQRVGDNQRKTAATFVAQAQSVHAGKYDYSLVVDYKRPDQKIPIVCTSHGMFLQRASDHMRGSGCPKCSHRVSRPEKQWLDSLGIPPENRQVWITLPNANFQVDGYDPTTNTVYEFWGDYWHGNPRVYSDGEVNATNGVSFAELYRRTVDKKTALVDSGFAVIEMWEHEWKQISG